MTEENKSKRRVELMKKRLNHGLTLAEAHELAILENFSLVPWKNCEKHEQAYLYSSKCPICID